MPDYCPRSPCPCASDPESLKTQLSRLLIDACTDPSQPENAALLRYFVTVGLTANAFLRQSSTAKQDSAKDVS